ASQPEATAPTRRIHSVTVRTRATAVRGTPNSFEIAPMISRNTVKSKASSVQPSHAAHQAIHWSLVGSFHHGTAFGVPAAADTAHTSHVTLQLRTSRVTAADRRN